ncbi:hypothetical protein BOO30_11025 [Vibrio navarrensis]|uniref:hypothetical protein n=1 Tax=Vibrio navarrensis TaxID=29495 RepID=UPI0018699522|nr:hypothetical protein [Vibrio navarrensis]MBE4578250.1 hypothetical protein [Vibrio navarrensis]MBE4596933.1 hypothetical protein [Vibrio navarrensis]
MINGKLIGLGVSVMSLIMTGCASTSQPVSYDESHSRAYNIAQAGGLYEVKDKYVPRENYESLQFIGDSATNALLFNSSIGTGLDLTTSLGLGVLMSAIELPGNSSRDSFIAWMPVEEAQTREEARDLLMNEYQKSIKSVFSDIKAQYGVIRELDKLFDARVSQYYFYSDELNCPKFDEREPNKKLCSVGIAAFLPVVKESPMFVLNGDRSYAFLSNSKSDYNRINIYLPEDSKIKKDDLLSLISEKLPYKSYIYVSSGELAFGESKVKANYLLDNGEPLLFIHPEK